MAACCAVPTVLHLPSCAKEELRASDRDSDDLLNWVSYKPEAKPHTPPHMGVQPRAGRTQQQSLLYSDQEEEAVS